MDGTSSFADEDNQAGTLPSGTHLGKYQIVQLLGAGGMGAVYEAVHTEIGKRVAVKVLSPAIAAIPGTRGRFLREAQLTSRVRHPNIVDVTDMGSEAGQTFLVMELLRGEDLAHRLARVGRLPPDELADIMLPVCSAIVAAHEVGVTHRDLKPSNIFLAESQYAMEPKVLDFGISKGMDSSVGTEALTGTGAMVGTPYYLAPEQVVDNRSAGPSSDQYALGVILYECLTGVRPFESENLYAVFRDIVAGSAPPPRAHHPDIVPALEEVVLRAMHVDPKRRYESTAALGIALLPFASGRARSIWQDAFSTPAADGAVSEARSQRAVAMTRVLTPAASGGSGGPAGFSGPIGLAGGTQISTPPPRGSRSGRFQLPENYEEDLPMEAIDLRGGGSASRLWLGVAAAAALVVGGIVTWFVVGDSPSGPALSESSKKKRRPVPRVEEEVVLPTDPAPPAAKETAEVPQDFLVSLVVDPDSALIELDGRSVGRGRLERSLPRDHRPHRLRIAAEGYNPEIIEFVDEPPPKKIVLTSLSGNPKEQNSRDRARSTSRQRSRRPGSRAAAEPPKDRRVNESPREPSSSGGSARGGLSPNGAPIID